MRNPNNPQFEEAQQLPPDAAEAMQQQLTVEARMAAIAGRLKPEQQEVLYRANAAYGQTREQVGWVSIKEMHKQAGQAPAGYDAYSAGRQLDDNLEQHFQALDGQSTVGRATEEVAAQYGLNAPPKESFAKIMQDDAKRRLSQDATGHFRDYTVSKKQEAATLLDQKAEAVRPGAPTEADEEVAAGIGADDLDNRLHNRLDAIETALNNRIPQTAGRAILRKLSARKDLEAQSADFDVTKAIHDFEDEMRKSGQSPWATDETRTVINSYMKDNGLLQPGKEEYAALISEVAAEIGPTITANEARNYIKDKLGTITVPQLKTFGLLKDPNETPRYNQSAGNRRAGFNSPMDDFIDDILSGRFGTKDQKHTYTFGKEGVGSSGPRNGYGGHDRTQGPRGREQSPEEQDVVSEIARLRDEGMPDNKIKQHLLKKYRDPTGQNDDPRAKVVSDQFRPKNSSRHYGA